MKMDHYCKGTTDLLETNDEEEEQPVQIVRLWEDTWEHKKLKPSGDPILEASQKPDLQQNTKG